MFLTYTTAPHEPALVPCVPPSLQALCGRVLSLIHEVLGPACYAAGASSAGRAALPSLLSGAAVFWYHVTSTVEGVATQPAELSDAQLSKSELQAALSSGAARLLTWGGSSRLLGPSSPAPGNRLTSSQQDPSSPPPAPEAGLEGAWYYALSAPFKVAEYLQVGEVRRGEGGWG
jgi:hypothetical protein